MAPRWSYLRARLAAACAAAICATSVGAAQAAFDYTVDPVEDVEVEGSSAIEPADPDLCDTDLGWIETFNSRFEAEAIDQLVPVSRSVRVSRGMSFERTSPEYMERFAPRPVRFPASLTVDYTGCVVPSGRVLLSLTASVSFDVQGAVRRFVVTYDGPPMPTWRKGDIWASSWNGHLHLRSRDARRESFTIETDLGDAILSNMELKWWPQVSAEQHKHFSISLRLKSEGDSQ